MSEVKRHGQSITCICDTYFVLSLSVWLTVATMFIVTSPRPAKSSFHCLVNGTRNQNDIFVFVLPQSEPRVPVIMIVDDAQDKALKELKIITTTKLD